MCCLHCMRKMFTTVEMKRRLDDVRVSVCIEDATSDARRPGVTWTGVWQMEARQCWTCSCIGMWSFF